MRLWSYFFSLWKKVSSGFPRPPRPSFQTPQSQLSQPVLRKPHNCKRLLLNNKNNNNNNKSFSTRPDLYTKAYYQRLIFPCCNTSGPSNDSAHCLHPLKTSWMVKVQFWFGCLRLEALEEGASLLLPRALLKSQNSLICPSWLTDGLQEQGTGRKEHVMYRLKKYILNYKRVRIILLREGTF